MTLLSATKTQRLKRALDWSARDWAELVVAVGELARARMKLDTFRYDGSANVPEPLDKGAAETALRIGRAITRGASVVPWRSDCLIQALAGQAWLARSGMPSRIVLGARSADNGRLDAHAWLECAGIVVVGAGAMPHAPFTRQPQS